MNTNERLLRKSVTYLYIGVFLLGLLGTMGISQNYTASNPISVSSSSTVSGALSVSDVVVSPTPVAAGSNVTLSFSLFDSYSQTLNNVNIGISSSSELINVSPSRSYLVSAIGTGIYGGIGSNPFVYTIHIPSTMQSGVYTIDVVANYETTTSGGSINLPGSSVMPITIYVHGKPKLNFNLQQQTTITPGSTFSFDLTESNTGTGTARNISVSLLNSNNFQVLGQSNYVFADTAPGGQLSFPVELLLSSNITSGEHNISIYVKYNGTISNFAGTVNVPINIPLGKPELMASIISAQPQQIYAGGNQTITVQIQNIGNGMAKNITAYFNNSNDINVEGSASQFYIGSLAPGASVEENVFITANNNPTYNDSYIPAVLSYYSANFANKTNTTVHMRINVGKSSVFQIMNVTDALYPGNSYGAIIISIKNTGNQEAKQISFALQSIYPISPIAGDAYVNDLQPGQSTNITFYVSADQNGNSGQYPITIYEQWKQNNGAPNQVFYGSNNYYATIYSNAGAAASANPSSSGSEGTIAAIIIVAVIALIAVFAYRRMQKRKAVKPEKAKK